MEEMKIRELKNINKEQIKCSQKRKILKNFLAMS